MNDELLGISIIIVICSLVYGWLISSLYQQRRLSRLQERLIDLVSR